MLIFKWPGNFPKWRFMSPPKVLMGKIEGSLFDSNFIDREIEAQWWSDLGIKGLLRDILNTVEVYIMPQNPRVGLKFHVALELLPPSPLALLSTPNTSFMSHSLAPDHHSSLPLPLYGRSEGMVVKSSNSGSRPIRCEEPFCPLLVVGCPQLAYSLVNSISSSVKATLGTVGRIQHWSV